MSDSYAASGVDTHREEVALDRLKRWVGATIAFRPEICAKVSLSAFASVLDLGGGRGLAISTDGVGTKLLVAQLAKRYDTVGIDCVAMNANDIVAIGAEPIAMLDYLAIEQVDGDVFEAIGKGLHEGARQAGLAIVGGETSQISEMIRGVRPGSGFDLVGMCAGLIDLARVVDGARIEPGDIVIGIASSGVHSNGLTLARRVLLCGGRQDHEVDQRLGRSPLAELLVPTTIYVRPVLALLHDPGVDVRGLAHITGDGLLNLARVVAPVGFELDALPKPQAVFEVIASQGQVSPAEMYTTFNMGIGFCVVVAPASVARTLQVLASYSQQAQVIGHVVADDQRSVHLPSQGLLGRGRHFQPR
jgi:phosphoribosylformylglycinamidine cyclo-ligase